LWKAVCMSGVQSSFSPFFIPALSVSRVWGHVLYCGATCRGSS
jgi:hypothetical protein